MENYEDWQIKLCGPLGKALDHLCSRTFRALDYNVLLEPFRRRSALQCGADSLLWGKAVSSALLCSLHDPDPAALERLRESLYSMAALQDETGEISAFPPSARFQYWDLEARRYILRAFYLGWQIFGKDQVLADCCVRMTDQLMSLVGPGKRSILHCGQQGGLDSSAILDSIVGVCRLSGEKRFLDFARYIADTGCSQQHNIFTALMNGQEPCELGNGNAEALNGCFKGLIELCKFDPDSAERYTECCKRYFKEITAKELFITGTGGGGNREGTRWFRGAVHQSDPDSSADGRGNTRVTVSCLELFEAMHRFDGSLEPLALAERSLYNALLGAWDESSGFWYDQTPFPMTGSSRGELPETLFRRLSGIGGLALAPRLAAVPIEEGAALNFYEDMELSLPRNVKIKVKGGFPSADSVEITIRSRREVAIALRIPDYCTGACYCGCLLDWHKGQYLYMKKKWKADEVLTVTFDPKVRRVDALEKAPYEALVRGPVVLAEKEGAEELPSLVRTVRNKKLLMDCASAAQRGGTFSVWYKKLLPKYLFHYFDYD